MQCNVGGAERGLRFLIGAAALAAALFLDLTEAWTIGLFAIGAIGLATAAFRYCPLNSLTGRNTCRSS